MSLYPGYFSKIVNITILRHVETNQFVLVSSHNGSKSKSSPLYRISISGYANLPKFYICDFGSSVHISEILISLLS